jgi:hypothetical protein
VVVACSSRTSAGSATFTIVVFQVDQERRHQQRNKNHGLRSHG